MLVRTYNVHGVLVECRYDAPLFELPLDHLLWNFASASPDRPDAILTLTSGNSIREAVPPDVAGEPIFRSRLEGPVARSEIGLEFDAFQVGDLLHLDVQNYGSVQVDAAAQRATLSLHEANSLHPDLLSSLLLFCLSHLLRFHRLHLIHAAAVELNGLGVLIPGTRGSGKTTTSLALVNEGFRFLSDDVVFVRQSEAGAIELCGIPERLSVTEKTVEMVSTLNQARDALEDGLLKQHFPIDAVYRDVRESTATAQLVIFPRITGKAESTLESLKPSRALEMLLPHAISVLQQDTAKDTFALLSGLVSQSPCLRLMFGTDLPQVARLVRVQLQQPCTLD